MKSKHSIEIHPKNRFNLARMFEQNRLERGQNEGADAQSVKFRQLKNIDDPDEKHESLHCMR